MVYQFVDWMCAFSMTETAELLRKALLIGAVIELPVYMLATKLSEVICAKVSLKRRKRKRRTTKSVKRFQKEV